MKDERTNITMTIKSLEANSLGQFACCHAFIGEPGHNNISHRTVANYTVFVFCLFTFRVLLINKLVDSYISPFDLT